MTRYSVELTHTARRAIEEQAGFIATAAGAPLEAARWLGRILSAVESLERWPRRTGIAEESAFVKDEVRQLVIGRHLLLFVVDEARRTVTIVGLRHGHRRPRPITRPDERAQQGD